MATYQINKFKLHFERAFNYLSHDITHVYDKKSKAFFLNLGNWMFFKLSQEAGVQASELRRNVNFRQDRGVESVKQRQEPVLT